MNTAAEAEAAPGHDPVTITVDAASSQAPVARSLAETMAILYGFGLDEVADVKLAVDEACAQLERAAAQSLHGSGAGIAVSMTIEARAGAMSITVTADLPGGAVVRGDGFGWHVLRTLTDDVEAAQDSDGGRRWRIGFTKSSAAL